MGAELERMDPSLTRKVETATSDSASNFPIEDHSNRRELGAGTGPNVPCCLVRLGRDYELRFWARWIGSAGMALAWKSKAGAFSERGR